MAIVNGKKKACFILDSGASANLFHKPAMAGLDLPIVGSLPAKGIGGFEQVSMVQTDSVSIGDLTLYGQISGSVDLGKVSRATPDSTPFGGLLGYDFLSRFPVMVDYANRILTVYDPECFEPPEGGDEIPFHLTMQVPTIKAELVGIPGSFLVDLGNALGLIVHGSFVQANRLEEKLDDVRVISRPMGGIGGRITGKSAYAASFGFGDVRIHSLRVLLTEPSDGIVGSEELAGNIGNLVLEQFRVLFDYHSSRLIFYQGSEP